MKTLLTLLALATVSLGIAQGVDFYGKSVADKICPQFQMKDDKEVQDCMDKICTAADIPDNFVLVPCPNIDNCQALSEDGILYIVYDINFFNKVKAFGFTEKTLTKNSVDWAAITILAHELGHHMLLHTTNRLLRERYTPIQIELQADEYAGKVLYRLGSTLPQAQKVMYGPDVPDQATLSHPARADRLAAIAKGWQFEYAKANKNQQPVASNPQPVTDNLQPTNHQPVSSNLQPTTQPPALQNIALVQGGTLFSNLFTHYAPHNGASVTFQSVGSGAGFAELTKKQVDFIVSDAPLNAEQSAKFDGDMLNIPVGTLGVVMTYNLPGVVAPLRLSSNTLAGIFLGTITKWDDRQIVAENKGMVLPSFPILVVHRSDGNGTTNMFTQYLSKVSPDWYAKVGSGNAVNWPAGLGGKGNEGVAGLVRQTPGAIGYVDFTFAEQGKLPYADIRNKKGKFITPSLSSITKAGNVQLPSDAKITIADTDVPDGYPIAGFVYILIYKEQDYSARSLNQATSLVNFISWLIHVDQQYSLENAYAPLAKPAVVTGEKLLLEVTFDRGYMKL